jgi:adenosylcobyric acid synthase
MKERLEFLIAAPTSGSGKTTVALGLMARFAREGKRVQPFKCGPDYIDTKFHEVATGRPSVNLDLYMMTEEQVRATYAHYAEDADVCIVEGMMGMFDGYDRERGSCADIARVLGLPVVLVVQARSAAFSMAPLLQGFVGFDKRVKVAGVIFNQVGSERHAQMLREVCAEVGVPCLGCLPRQKDLEQGSRYLGLDFSQKVQLEKFVELVKRVEMENEEWRMKNEEWRMENEEWRMKNEQWRMKNGNQDSSFIILNSSFKNVLVARNAESFSFIYQQTLDSFASVRFFDPETEVPCFDGVDVLYVPGGYPEKHVEALAAQEQTREAIRAFAEGGGRIVAECGGMMYLCQSIVTDEGEYAMCGVLPYRVTARTADRKLSLGYRRFVLTEEQAQPLALPAGECRGHEFHYTRFLDPQPVSAVQVFNAKDDPVSSPIIIYKGVLASYVHIGGVKNEELRMKNEEIRIKNEELRMKSEKFDFLSDSKKDSSFFISHSSFHSSLMFVGTGSDVGKSVVAAAFCRIFKQDGLSPAPFKAQNMALNSYATPDGLEIGRAQAVQAEAAGIPCCTDMNPLLLKPQSDHTSQVVLNGRPIGNRDAYDYFRCEGREQLRREVCAAYDRLAARYSPIVMEGAGSISELNLKDSDLVNMPMARHADANVILVGDIDRGGVFASVYGSIALQSEEDRRRIKGIIINKFRGDMRLFDEGRRILENICGVPVLGVIPYFKDIHIEEEDSVSLAQKSRQMAQGRVNVAVVMLQHISNFTDFDALEHDPRIHLFYTQSADDLSQADIVIVPGSKSTLHDLYELRRNGMAQAIVRAHREGKTVLGICGGYQMLGVEVCDPLHVEGDIDRLPGLGLLPTTTVLAGEKRTVQVRTQEGYVGYEIHNGETRPFGDAKPSPLFVLDDGREDGYKVSERCMGTYVHGILDNRAFVDELLQPYVDKLKQTDDVFDYRAFKEQQYDKLADHVRQHVDMNQIYRIMGYTFS